MDSLLVKYAQRLDACLQNLANDKICYTTRLNNNSADIVELLGGLHTVIQLCLTNPAAKDYIHEENLKSLQRILDIDNLDNKDNQDDDHDHDGNNSENGSKDPEQQEDIYQEYNKLTMNYNNKKNLHKISRNKRNGKQENNVKHLTIDCVSDTRAWYTNAIFINIDMMNNLYFRYFAPQIAQFIVFEILQNKWYPFMIMVMVFVGIIGDLILSWILYDKIEFGASYLSLCAVFIWGITATTYVLSANIQVFKLVMQTFNFMFKTYNAIILCICFYLIDVMPGLSVFIKTMWILSLLQVLLFVFINDAILLPLYAKRVRNILVYCLCIFGIYGFIIIYFKIEDNVYINPFEKWNVNSGGVTNISVKQLLLQSLGNVIVFSLVPVVSPVLRRIIKACIGANTSTSTGNSTSHANLNSNSSGNSININSAKNVTRYHHCSLIYKKPKLIWSDPSALLNVNHCKQNDSNEKQTERETACDMEINQDSNCRIRSVSSSVQIVGSIDDK